MLDRIETFQEQIILRKKRLQSEVGNDILSLGIMGFHVALEPPDYIIQVYFWYKEDLNLYKLVGNFKQSDHYIEFILYE